MVSWITLQRSIPEKKYFLWYLLTFYSTRYEKVIILGDFDIDTENKVTKNFL